MSVASWSGSLLAWEEELAALKACVGGVLGRRELRETGAVEFATKPKMACAMIEAALNAGAPCAYVLLLRCGL